MMFPVAASHTRTVPSSLPVAIVFPSGLNATLLTSSVCPVSFRMLPHCGESWAKLGVMLNVDTINRANSKEITVLIVIRFSDAKDTNFPNEFFLCDGIYNAGACLCNSYRCINANVFLFG